MSLTARQRLLILRGATRDNVDPGLQLAILEIDMLMMDIKSYLVNGQDSALFKPEIEGILERIKRAGYESSP